jgi:hypothetical protein
MDSKLTIRKIRPTYFPKIFILCTFLLATACNVWKTPNTNSEVSTTPRILFMNFSIVKNSMNEIHIALIDQTVVEGNMKGLTEVFPRIENGDLRFSAFNKEKKKLNGLIIPNPLHQSVEYVDDDGMLTRRTVILDSTFFSVRIPLLPSTAYIEIYGNEKPHTTYFTTKIYHNE